MYSAVCLPVLGYEVFICSWLTIKVILTSLVILDSHPIFTTIIILAGWAAKTNTASLVSRWVGGDEKTGEEWLAYSIP
jgi:hypothetical protein